MHILVTGGAGYIGTQLVKQLAEKPEIKKVTVYDNLSRANFNLFIGPRFEGAEKIEFIKGELLDSRALGKALKGVDAVYHLAAKVTTPFDNTDPHFYEQVNHWGTAELIYAVEETETVKKFVFVSSTSVYGANNELVDDTTATNPHTYYGVSKWRGEDHVKRLSEKIDTYIYRCGNVYGYNKSMRFDAVINKFMFDAHFANRITIHGNGHQHRAFIHIDKVAKALAETLFVGIEPGIYNLVDKNLQVLDVVEALKNILPQLEFIFINQHLAMREMRVKPNEAVNALLGISEQTDLETELKAFAERFSF